MHSLLRSRQQFFTPHTPAHTDTHTPVHTLSPFSWCVTKGRPISQPQWQFAAFLLVIWQKERKTLSPLCRYHNCVDTESASDDWPVSLCRTSLTHSSFCVRARARMCMPVSRGSTGLRTSPRDVTLSHKRPHFPIWDRAPMINSIKSYVRLPVIESDLIYDDIYHSRNRQLFT